MASGSWLVHEDVDRRRMLDMDRRLQPVRRASFGVLGVALLASGPWLGFWTLIPLVLAAVVFRLADTRIERLEHPEHALFAAWAASVAIIAISVAMTGGAKEPTMSWLAIPIVTLTARFSQRGIAVGVALTIALMLAVAFGSHGADVFHDPPLVFAPVALVLAVAMLSSALMRSDVEHRSEAVVDQLTGMLNRRALTTRLNELREQSTVTGDPVGAVAADLDHFKRVNDEHGHAVGDAVLRHVAYVLRKHLRAFDLAYRVGGEEFLVLVPGATVAQAAELAEELRGALLGATFPENAAVTMSFGVSGSVRGSAFNADAVLGAADTALYDAKRRGRNRVEVAGAPLPRG